MATKEEMYKSLSFSSLGVNEIPHGGNDWRNKIEVPVFSQVGRRKGVITLKYKPIIAAFIIFVFVLFFYYFVSSTKHKEISKLNVINKNTEGLYFARNRKLMSYNKTYPLTRPVTTSSGFSFRIGLITDMDKESKDTDKTWHSLLRNATLYFNNQSLSVNVKIHGEDEDATKLISGFANGGRGMELSELIVFNAHVYTVDDRTGIIYEILEKRVAPWAILSDGNGKQTKGFKGEWMAVKNEKLYVGGLGKEWTTATGKVLHSNPQWVKTVDKDGSVMNYNWVPHYVAMQEASGYVSPGYIIHESAVWSDLHNSWFFLPRRASHEKYDESLDEHRATNLLFKCSENFKDIKVVHVGKLESLTRGFSSFKFVPGSGDRVIVALKTEEVLGKTKSYITAFTIDGDVIFSDKMVSDRYKYEGVEFL